MVRCRDRVRDVVGDDRYERAALRVRSFPPYGHRSGVIGIVGGEVDRIHDPFVGDEFDEVGRHAPTNAAGQRHPLRRTVLI